MLAAVEQDVAITWDRLEVRALGWDVLSFRGGQKIDPFTRLPFMSLALEVANPIHVLLMPAMEIISRVEELTDAQSPSPARAMLHGCNSIESC